MANKHIKTQITMRITKEGQQLLALLAAKRGVSKAAVVEILIREKADDDSVYIEDAINDDDSFA